MSNPMLWQPDPARVARANLIAFIDQVQRCIDTHVQDFAGLYKWSVERREEFWPALWRFCEVRSGKGWDTILEDGHKMPGSRWFVGARLNFADNLLRYRDDHEALVFWGEDRVRRRMTYAELYAQVTRTAVALRNSGVKTGDRVAGFLSNMPEAIVAMLAAASIGAIWSSCSPDFGIAGVMDRFGQIQPRILFAADGYFYNGKTINILERVKAVVDQIPAIEQTVIVPYAHEAPHIDDIRGAILFDNFIAYPEFPELKFEQLPFDHPLYIMYSSGTTGIPKCIVHGAGGTLLQHLKELVLHTDLKREDRIFYFTTCGWMMWNWLVSSLAVGATVLLYDGAPFHPHGNTLFNFAQEEKMTVFGTSAKFIATAEKEGVEPIRTHNLSSLRTMLSTGSPLAPESFDYVYSKIKKDICLSSISGGTDIISCFALGNPIGPVYRGELQTRGLGMDVQVYDEDGRSVRNLKGELVCVKSFPSMPIYFWNDPDGSKYHSAYFDRFPNIWCHGDYAELTDHDGMIIHGRSDATLNPGGVRIGTAEIYSQVEQLPEILESLVIGQDWENDVRIILFVKLRPNLTLDEPLIEKIKKHIRASTTPRHVPAKVVQVTDIPRTLSGKIVELAVRNLIHNRPVKNADALANPQVLEQYKNRRELET